MAQIAIPATARPSRRGGAASRFLHELWRSGTGLFGLAVLVLTALAAIFAPVLAPDSPTKQDLRNRLAPPLWWGGTTSHPLGTDQLGRDLLSRMLYGARVTLLVGLAVVVIAGTFGIVVGIFSGYVGGLTDTVTMRVIDTLLAFPGILLALVILYAIGPSVTLLVIVLSINGWMVYARVARGSVLTLRNSEYVEAAEVVGARPARVMFRHLLPNLTSPLLTLAVLEFARIILAEAALSFLGYGVQPPKSSWGLIIAQGQNYLSSAWWLVVVPGIAISLTVLASNLFASWLRIYADPRQREKHLGDALAEQAAAATPPVRMSTVSPDRLLEIKDLAVAFPSPDGPVFGVENVTMNVAGAGASGRRGRVRLRQERHCARRARPRAIAGADHARLDPVARARHA